MQFEPVLERTRNCSLPQGILNTSLEDTYMQVNPLLQAGFVLEIHLTNLFFGFAFARFLGYKKLVHKGL